VKKPRVLVVDDSASSRAALADALTAKGCEIVGRAMDGGIALRLALELEPDVITCDLEMPHMDGLTFLRILAQEKPLPVIVVTSDARPETAIRALELGARDFVVKPAGGPRDFARLGDALAARAFALTAEKARERVLRAIPDVEVPRVDLVVIGASTGGPRALRDVLGALDRKPRVPIAVCQHMPAGFTATFAERLSRATGLDVQEATNGAPLVAGAVRIAPGGAHFAIAPAPGGFFARVEPAAPTDGQAPSVDRLFVSAAACAGERVLGVVLTGMGRDGRIGAAHLAASGAPLWVEDASTAVVDGMPAAAADAHPRAVRLPLDAIGAKLARAVL
jgi:two-component system chemotaxis response regulator CheB